MYWYDNEFLDCHWGSYLSKGASIRSKRGGYFPSYNPSNLPSVCGEVHIFTYAIHIEKPGWGGWKSEKTWWSYLMDFTTEEMQHEWEIRITSQDLFHL